jgi:undecaprenyl-diphosphatase
VQVWASNNLLKSGVIVPLTWWAWFAAGEDRRRVRERLLAMLGGAVVSIFCARGLALALPFRYRPLHDPNIDFVLAYGWSTIPMDGWSSFPSDHAALFFAIAVGLFAVSRGVGIVALLYATFFVGLPRVILGLHYPSDVVAGAVIGATAALMSTGYFAKTKLVRKVAGWEESFTGPFYAALFLLTYQIADIFETSRAVASTLRDIARTFLR